MTNTITVEQLKELLQIQKEFDERIPTLNLEDSTVAYIVEFFEWFNTIETFKNWKANPGKSIDVQLDELSDMLAFGLSIANQQGIDVNALEGVLPKIGTITKDYKTNGLVYGFAHDVANFGIEKEDAVLLPLNIASNIYSIEQLIAAYKKKMQRNHDRQDGKADTDKGYV